MLKLIYAIRHIVYVYAIVTCGIEHCINIELNLTFLEHLQITPPAEFVEEEEESLSPQAQIELWSLKEKELSPDAYAYGDEETRSFYQDLPDLRGVLPDSCLTGPGVRDFSLELEEDQDNEKEEYEEEVDEGDYAESEDEEDVDAEPITRNLRDLLDTLPDIVTARACDAFCLEFCHQK